MAASRSKKAATKRTGRPNSQPDPDTDTPVDRDNAKANGPAATERNERDTSGNEAGQIEGVAKALREEGVARALGELDEPDEALHASDGETGSGRTGGGAGGGAVVGDVASSKEAALSAANKALSVRTPRPFIAGTVFIGFLTTGGIFILSVKLLALELSLPSIALVPVGLLVFFAGTISLSGLRDDQTGDNIYYMGFLFTLISMAASLVQFTLDQGSSTDIIRNFGVAVFSTIGGVALRVLYNQALDEPSDVEQEVRLEIARAAKLLKTELEGAVEEFAQLRGVIRETMTDGFRQMTDQVELYSSKLLGGVDQVTTKAGGALDAYSSRLTDSLEQVTAKADDVMAQAARASAALASAGTAIAGDTTKATESMSQLADSANKANDGLRKLAQPENLIRVELQQGGSLVRPYDGEKQTAVPKRRRRMGLWWSLWAALVLAVGVTYLILDDRGFFDGGQTPDAMINAVPEGEATPYS